MKCLVLSFLMGYNGQAYKKGDYVEVADEESVKRLVRERCISIMPFEEPKKEDVEFSSSSSILNKSQREEEEKAEERRRALKPVSKRQVKTVKRGAKK